MVSRIAEALNKPYCQITLVDSFLVFTTIAALYFLCYAVYMLFKKGKKSA